MCIYIYIYISTCGSSSGLVEVVLVPVSMLNRW